MLLEGVPTASEAFAAFVADMDPHGVPVEVKRAAVLHALDAVGCGLAAHALGEASYAASAVEEDGCAGPASAIGVPTTATPGNAAFVNGTLCHALDFDDTHPGAVVHVSAAVTPAALAAGEHQGASGRTVLAALVAGNEVSVRVGMAAGGVFHARGFHPTGVCGVFGATAAAARVRGLDRAKTAHALGIAGSMAAGLLEFLSDGAETKRLHPGWAAQAGLAAVRLAAYGATGPATVFEGARGYFATYVHGFAADIATQVADLGDRWETPNLAYKPYPACHYTHAPIDALAQLLKEHPLRPDGISDIVAFTDDTGISLVLEPVADKLTPRSAYDAKFSLPYCLARQVVHGSVDVSSFTPEAIVDADVLALMPLVRYERRQYSPRPDAFGGGVRLTTTDGRTYEVELRHQRGGTENPICDADVVDKFRANASLALPPDKVSELEERMLDLEAQDDLSFLGVLRTAARRSA